MNKLDHKLTVAYEKIPKNAQTAKVMVTQKIDHIVHIIDQYQEEIEHFMEHITPTTPLEVKKQRK
jgi:hypothetical protein